MITYSMRIVNEDNCEKTVYVTSSSFMDAIRQIRYEHGCGWSVYSYTIVHSDY